MPRSRISLRARSILHTAALATVLSTNVLALSACTQSDLGPGDTIGSVEGFGGLGGRVGTPAIYEAVATQKPTPMRIGSSEGFGGYVGRVGQPALTPDAVEAAQQQR